MNSDIIAKRNRYDIQGDTGTLTITKRDGSEYVVTFDTADLRKLKRYGWRVVTSRGGYIYPYSSEGDPLGHYLMGTDQKQTQISYIDGNTLNVCRANLKQIKRKSRITWKKSDGSGYVSYHKTDRRWYAYAWRNSRKVYLGGWPDRDSAIEAFRAAGD